MSLYAVAREKEERGRRRGLRVGPLSFARIEGGVLEGTGCEMNAGDCVSDGGGVPRCDWSSPMRYRGADALATRTSSGVTVVDSIGAPEGRALDWI